MFFAYSLSTSNLTNPFLYMHLVIPYPWPSPFPAIFILVYKRTKLCFLHSQQGSPNYNPWARSGPLQGYIWPMARGSGIFSMCTG